jgi:hypothetical protein
MEYDPLTIWRELSALDRSGVACENLHGIARRYCASGAI